MLALRVDESLTGSAQRTCARHAYVNVPCTDIMSLINSFIWTGRNRKHWTRLVTNFPGYACCTMRAWRYAMLCHSASSDFVPETITGICFSAHAFDLHERLHWLQLYTGLC